MSDGIADLDAENTGIKLQPHSRKRVDVCECVCMWLCVRPYKETETEEHRWE